MDASQREIERFELAVRDTDRGVSPERWAAAHYRLGVAYRRRTDGDRAANIEHAIAHYEQALRVYTLQEYPRQWAMVQNSLAVAYRQRPAGDPADNVDRAIEYHSRALEVYTREDSPEKYAATHGHLASLYKDRLNGVRATNVECAIEHYDLALRIYTPANAPEEWGILQNDLATVYHYRMQGSRAENIEQAIEHYALALTVRTRDRFPHRWAMTQSNLASAYCVRIRGDRADNIERAIELFTQVLAVRTRQAYPVEYAQTHNNLANAFQLRLRGKRVANLDRAIAHYRRALRGDIRELSPRNWALAQGNLASAYRQRPRGDHVANLERAITAAQLALTVYDPVASPSDWARTQNELATAYRDRGSGDKADNIELAIAHYELAVSAHTREAYPSDWAILQNNLGIAYHQRISGDPATNRQVALGHIRQALDIYRPSTYPAECLNTARNLGNLYFAEGCWREASEAYSLGMEAADMLYRATLLRGSREAELREAGDLHRRAAYALAKMGSLQEAIVTLERGRARNLSDALGRERSQMDDLRLRNLDLYDHYGTIIEELCSLESKDLQGTGLAPEDRSLVDVLEQAYTDLRQAVERIRATRGFEDFWVAPSFKDVSVVACHASLVYIVLVGPGTVALIVWPDATVSAVWFDELNEAAIHERLYGHDEIGSGYIEAYGAWRDRPNDIQVRQTWRGGLEQTLVWLNDALMGLLAQMLHSRGIKAATLIPVGPLALLPLHAAAAASPVTFAYAPNARVLAGSMRGAQETEPLRALVVADPNPDGSLALPLSPIETMPLTNVPNATLHILAGTDATVETVRQELQYHNLWHFGTHGTVDWNSALDDVLFLADESRLRLRDILSLRANARLAVLSACETGIPDRQLPDEVISLAAGMIQAGAASVVSSLWVIEDFSTALLLRRFYEELQGEVDGRAKSVAMALRSAQQWLAGLTKDEVRRMLLDLMDCPAIGLAGQHALLGQFVALTQRGERPFAHPYYWAGIFAMGNAFEGIVAGN